ncbi:MAG: FISUMP domain-containing protein [Bacteroidota bacterium]
MIVAIHLGAQTNNSFTDARDSKTYKTISIGTQTWMAENIAYKAGNGCWAYNDNAENAATYGYLYWYETAKTVCPTGWHLPSDAEWILLVKYLQGEKVAGSKLKQNGFLPLAAGFRNTFGVYSGLTTHGMWWSSTWNSAMNAWYRLLTFESSKFEKRSLGKMSAFSVRSVKD